MEFLDKGVELTANQYKAVGIALKAANALYAEASPTDDTPLKITYGEVLEALGKQLISRS